ncbi:MAG: ribonuclease Y [Chloroflexi bacterium]|nr:ribonuclease Y [Chloroflexota bacterium]
MIAGFTSGTILLTLVSALFGGVLGYFLFFYRAQTKIRSAGETAQHILEEAQGKAKEILLEAGDEALRIRKEAESEGKQWQRDLRKQERQLQKRRENLDSRLDALENRSRSLEAQKRDLDRAKREIAKKHEQQVVELERVSQLSKDDAKELLLKRVEQESRQDMARVMREVEARTQEEAEQKAREIIVSTIQRIASESVTEVSVSAVPLPNDDLKGRIIGRGGRNIRAIENATGVDLVVDDTPEAVIISSFDPIRREVARLALTKLVADGRIHPARIEKVVSSARKEVENIIQEEGERAVYEVGVRGLHPELIKLLGRLKFRTSYGQNQHAHAIESAHIAGLLAMELGANAKMAKMGALLHDIGKAVTHEVDGPHAQVGSELAKRYGVPPEVVSIIASHHHEAEQTSLEAIIVESADAISGARPGARRETLESYIKRITALEDVAHSFAGVEEAYAIQAGREIRIVVRPDEVDDLSAIQLSKNIARKVEEGLTFPGQIKVTVIRETRAVDYAK